MTEIISGLSAEAGSGIIYMIIMIILSYLVGSISPSIILARRKGIDIKREGSGNAGTTNTLRVLGKKAAVITLVTDILKGFAAVIAAQLIIGRYTAMICLFAVFAGHVWPIFYHFKGGKGVATLFGAILALSWPTALIALGVVVLVTAVSRRMSVGSIAGAASLPVISLFIIPEFFFPSTAAAILVIWNHRNNIKRLIRGEEPKLGEKKKEKA